MKNGLGEPTRQFRRSEFWLVMFAGLSWAIVASIATILNYREDRHYVAFSDFHAWSLVGWELLMGSVVYTALRHGGWRLADLRVNYSNTGTIVGFGLTLAGFGIMYVGGLLGGLVGAHVSVQDYQAPTAGFASVVVMSVVNALYEELITCAFVIQSLRGRFGLAFAMNASIAIRLTYHLYQGPVGFIPHTLFGLLVTFYYVRSGRLWPIIVAHTLIDVIILAGFTFK